MSDQSSSALPYILLATGAGVLGSVIALFWSPGAKVRSAIQHFAAGAVLAAVASNVIPEVERMSGFATGGLVWFFSLCRCERFSLAPPATIVPEAKRSEAEWEGRCAKPRSVLAKTGDCFVGNDALLATTWFTLRIAAGNLIWS